jgi:hypothetical protein
MQMRCTPMATLFVTSVTTTSLETVHLNKQPSLSKLCNSKALPNDSTSETSVKKFVRSTRFIEMVNA